METNIARENLHECFGKLTLNKLVKHNKIISREGFSFYPKMKLTINHVDTCVVKGDFNFHQVKCIKELQNF